MATGAPLLIVAMGTQVESWLLSEISDSATLRVLRNGIPLSIEGTLRERSNRVHSLATESLKAALVENLQGPPKDSETEEKPRVPAPIKLPPSSSPYAIRLSYITGSMNMQRDMQRTDFDHRVAEWELDLAATDVARFDEKVKTMVTGIVAALIGRTVDSRHEMITSRNYDIATVMGIITPLTLKNGTDTIEKRESRFASLLRPDAENIVPAFVTDADDLELVEKLNKQRETERRALLVSDKAFIMSRTVENTFLEIVTEAWKSAWDASKAALAGNPPLDVKIRKQRTLIKMHEYLPTEGEEFEIPEVSCIGGTATSNAFSIGNGASFVVECAEIARAYLEKVTITEGPEHRKSIVKTTNRTKDGKISAWSHAWANTPMTDKALGPFFTDAGILPVEAGAATEAEDDTFEPMYTENVTIEAAKLGEWIAKSFRGYCYQRQHTLDRPLFAKLVDCRDGAANEVTKLDGLAIGAGFIDLAASAKPGATEIGRYHYYRALRAAGGGDQTGRRIRHLGRYYVVSMCPVAAFSARSYMQYGEFWGPTLEHAAVESEACALLSAAASLMFSERKRQRYDSGRSETPPLVEKLGESGCTTFGDLFIFEGDKAKALAARLLRLVQTVQACNEVYRDAGTRNRTSVARDDLLSARASAVNAVLTYK